MKTILAALAVATLLWVGCGGEKRAEGEKDGGAGNPLTAPVDYLGAVGKAKQAAERTVETAYINQAIQLFHAQEGRYPRDLNELVSARYLPQAPVPPPGRRFEYNSADGTVRAVAQ